MPSLYLSRLAPLARADLLARLHSVQQGACFICGDHIDLELQINQIDIDHVIPLKLSGPDNESNFALTHSSCNRAKQASDLNVARILKRFEQMKESVQGEGRTINLDDVLKSQGGAKDTLKIKVENGSVSFSMQSAGKTQLIQTPLYHDPISGFQYFFAVLPLGCLHHVEKINPRPLGSNIAKLIQEFYQKRPQLHIQLAWLDSHDSDSRVYIFDGQHKASAQILLGAKMLPVRVFVDPDMDVLLATNFNAGTTLKQVAFDKSIQRHLGSALYADRVNQYKKDHHLAEEDYSFSERDLLRYFKGESREVKRYILDSVRDTITHNSENRLKDYIDFGGRGKEKPFSYSTIEKTFYSFFIFQEVLDFPINYKLEEGENPRELEKEQILELMNLIADTIYISKFDSDIGTSQIESKLQKGESLPMPHIIAYRMAKEEICYTWLKYVQQIIRNYFIMQGSPITEARLCQYPFPEPLWDRLRIFVRNLSNLPLWVNRELSSTVFGGKQNNEFWQTIFETGKSPQGIQVLSGPINLMEMIAEH
jgi:hypothetical protein